MNKQEVSEQIEECPWAPDVPMGFVARLRAIRMFHSGLETIRDAGGPVCMVRLGPARLQAPFAVVTSPRGARDVLAGSGAGFDKETILHIENRRMGENVFNLRHDRWIPRRRTLQPVFTKRHVAEYAGHMAEAAETVAADLIGRGSADLDAQMRRLTLRVIGRSVFGVDLGADAELLAPAVARCMRWMTHRSLRPVRSPYWLPTPARRRFRRSLAVINRVIDDVIDDAIDAARTGRSADAELILELLQATDPETGKRLSLRAVREELVAFLVAGHDTTATTLTYALWQLGRDRSIQERVAAEAAAIGDRPLTVADVADLPYTVQVLHEAMRLCPPAAALARLATRDVVVDGYRVPAGSNVVVGCYALHRDPALWADPERFDPDRFTHEQSKGRDRWQYLPFGGGPRSCIGDHFAMLEATLGLATIVRAAEVTSLEDDFPFALPFTMTAGGPIPAAVTARRPGSFTSRT